LQLFWSFKERQALSQNGRGLNVKWGEGVSVDPTLCLINGNDKIGEKEKKTRLG
jgi:hypothetical protein